MVFVDDYTRASWTYILKSRKEVLSRVQHFLLEIITQYETMVKILRTDNALEFTQRAIEELCLAHGIVHQTTCLYTSQQNGVAEWKHRHLLDMVRTLLLAMRVPQYLWCEVVLTTTYLVNRLPSAALGGAIPLQRLTPAADLFSLPPRVFGCTAFVQDHTPGLSKLAPRAQKGVFVGYSRTQKGYRVYFPDRRQYITSADVTFQEDVPYFTSTPSGEDPSSPALLHSVSATMSLNSLCLYRIPCLRCHHPRHPSRLTHLLSQNLPPHRSPLFRLLCHHLLPHRLQHLILTFPLPFARALVSARDTLSLIMSLLPAFLLPISPLLLPF